MILDEMISYYDCIKPKTIVRTFIIFRRGYPFECMGSGCGKWTARVENICIFVIRLG